MEKFITSALEYCDKNKNLQFLVAYIYKDNRVVICQTNEYLDVREDDPSPFLICGNYSIVQLKDVILKLPDYSGTLLFDNIDNINGWNH